MLVRALLLLLMMIPAAQASTVKAPQCVTGGCSGQLCVEQSQAGVASTCEWKETYACYKQLGTCEPQANGTCGWTPTTALTQCLQEKQPSERIEIIP